ncbi:MAG: hypothetical protein IT462_15565 [Planctomycetes bacterium]|nr:hypothetical protein [Planctomycetota bacterium]
MRYFIAVAVACGLALVACSTAPAPVTNSSSPAKQISPSKPTLQPDAKPHVEAAAQPPGTRRAPVPRKRGFGEIDALIDDLGKVDVSSPGTASFSTGFGFAPLPENDYASVLILTHEDMGYHPSFTKLVALGPKAIPALLDALEDPTPTSLMAGGGFISWCREGHELDRGELNEAERKALAAFPYPYNDEGDFEQPDFWEPPKGKHDWEVHYRVKVGDLCFAILGQITNCHLHAVRYQPSGGLMINSPVHDPWLADCLRAIWKNSEPAARLKRTLLADLRSTNDRNRRRSPGAATRLLYYFGEQCALDVLARLDRENWLRYPRSVDFINAIRFSTAPAAQARLAHLFRATADIPVADSILPVILAKEPQVYAKLLSRVYPIRRTNDIPKPGGGFVSQKALILTAANSTDPRITVELARCCEGVLTTEEMYTCVPAGAKHRPVETLAFVKDWLANHLADYEIPRGDGTTLLLVAATCFPDDALELIRSFSNSTEPKKRSAACVVLNDLELPQWKEVLLPLLDDLAEAGYGNFAATTIRADGSKRSHELPIRICDLAAWAATRRDAKLTFKVEGSYADLDKQITAIKQALGD